MSNLSGSPRDIAALVPMPILLESLGFTVNERTRRAPCRLRSGTNPSAFSWHEDGRWHCFSCDEGGDKISLVRAMKQCGFREAVQFLAALARVEYQADRIPHDEIARLQSDRDALRVEAQRLLEIEDKAWYDAREVVLRLEAIRRKVEVRIQAIHEGVLPRWRGELETAWAALAEVYRQMPLAAAAYSVASFSPQRKRSEFALDPQARARLIDEALERGYVSDHRGFRFDVLS